MTRIVAVTALALGCCACGAGGVRRPEIIGVSPQQISVGSSIAIDGAGFVGEGEGKTLLRIQGTYHDDQHKQHEVDRLVETTFEDSTRVTWRLWPDVVFHPEGNRLGYFDGVFQVINQRSDGQDVASDPRNVQIEVGPSLILRTLRPVGEAGSRCPMVVSGTLDDHPLAIAVEALGFQPGTPETPLEFTWSFGLEYLDVRPDDSAEASPDEGTEKTEATAVVVQTITDGAIAALKHGSRCGGRGSDVNEGSSENSSYLAGPCPEDTTGQKPYLFKVLDDVRAVPGVRILRTRTLPLWEPITEAQAPITVTVEDAAKRTGYLMIPLGVLREFKLIPEPARYRIVTRDAPARIQDVVGMDGVLGRETYRAGQPENKSIDFGSSASMNPPGGSLASNWGVQVARAFGIDSRMSRSSGVNQGLDDSLEVAPGFCATVWRQAEQVRKVGALELRDACGVTTRADWEFWFDDWRWIREVATEPGPCPAGPPEMKPAGPCTVDCNVNEAKATRQSAAVDPDADRG